MSYNIAIYDQRGLLSFSSEKYSPELLHSQIIIIDVAWNQHQHSIAPSPMDDGGITTYGAFTPITFPEQQHENMPVQVYYARRVSDYLIRMFSYYDAGQILYPGRYELEYYLFRRSYD